MLTIVRIGLLRLKNNPLELLLMFVVPIIFFSIFAMIFAGGIGAGKASAVRVAIVDNDETSLSRTLVRTLANEDGLRGRKNGDKDTGPFSMADDDADVRPELVSETAARNSVRNGEVAVAIVIPDGFGDSQSDEAVEIALLADTSDEVAPQLVRALVHQAIWASRAKSEFAPSELAPTGIPRPLSVPEGDSGSSVFEVALRDDGTRHDLQLATDSPPPRSPPGFESQRFADAAFPEPAGIRVEDLLSEDKANPTISMYAAGIAVMFLLFSASGAAGTLLEEQESGTLERLLASQLSLTGLLGGKWLLITLTGSLQIVVMFVFAEAVFGINLADHVGGFLLMTIVTAAAAASLALCLATACTTRNQLNGVSVIIILTMSALGGSMVPRYVMSEKLQAVGRFTFNAWALDGFNKLFWRGLPTSALGPELLMLVAATVILAACSRVLATRWQS